MKFAMSFSCGKDSTLALDRMIRSGHEPVCLIVMLNEKANRSYFHGADRRMLDGYANALNIPMLVCPACGERYECVFEDALGKARLMGAEAACFGDIDLEEHKLWGEERSKAANLRACYPLWGERRPQLVSELLRLGYQCVIKCIDQTALPMDLLGKVLNEETLRVITDAGADICGENGEYHTLTADGPIFNQPMRFSLGKKTSDGNYAFIDIGCE